MTAIDETINMLPPEAKQEVTDFVESVARKYREADVNSQTAKDDILKFAGAWKDMDDKDYEEFIQDIYQRRKLSFDSRRKS